MAKVIAKVKEGYDGIILVEMRCSEWESLTGQDSSKVVVGSEGKI